MRFNAKDIVTGLCGAALLGLSANAAAVPVMKLGNLNPAAPVAGSQFTVDLVLSDAAQSPADLLNSFSLSVVFDSSLVSFASVNSSVDVASLSTATSTPAGLPAGSDGRTFTVTGPGTSIPAAEVTALRFTFNALASTTTDTQIQILNTGSLTPSVTMNTGGTLAPESIVNLQAFAISAAAGGGGGPTDIPEPATALLGGIALLGLGLSRRRRV